MVQYCHKGRTQRIRIGSFGFITPHQARSDAQVLLGEIALGKSPAHDARDMRRSPTLAQVSQRFIKEHVNVKLKPNTRLDYIRTLEKYVLPDLGAFKINDITSADISKLHFKMSSTPTQANRTLSVLSKIFSLSERWGLRDTSSNPCTNIERYKEKSRTRFLEREELESLWTVLETAHEKGLTSRYAVSAYKLLILTGCRLGEIRTLKWEYIKGNRVTFPDTKTGYKRIPLNADAMQVLAATERKLDNEYVICGDVPGQPIINLQKSWRRIRNEAGLDDVRIHDLRHTFASHAVMEGTPLAIVGKLLGHSQIATTMRYAHLADAELADASEGIGRLLNHSRFNEPDSNVIPIRRANDQ